METRNHEYYVSPEVAKLLEKAEFDWECHKRYTPDGLLLDYPVSDEDFLDFDEVSAPTLEVAQKWLREVKNIAIYVCPAYEPISIGNNVDDKWIIKWQVAAINYNIEFDEIDLEDVKDKIFDIYEEAQEAGINKALEIILEK